MSHYYFQSISLPFQLLTLFGFEKMQIMAFCEKSELIMVWILSFLVYKKRVMCRGQGDLGSRDSYSIVNIL